MIPSFDKHRIKENLKQNFTEFYFQSYVDSFKPQVVDWKTEPLLSKVESVYNYIELEIPSGEDGNPSTLYGADVILLIIKGYKIPTYVPTGERFDRLVMGDYDVGLTIPVITESKINSLLPKLKGQDLEEYQESGRRRITGRDLRRIISQLGDETIYNDSIFFFDVEPTKQFLDEKIESYFFIALQFH